MANEVLTVSGTIRVRHPVRTLGNNVSNAFDSALPRAAVRVHGKRPFHFWRELGQTQTDFNGNFAINTTEKAGAWRFRIEVRLKADGLVVRQHTHADWETVLEQPEQRGEDLSGVTLIYGAKADSSADAKSRLDDPQDHNRAEDWMVARRMMKALENLGAPFHTDQTRPFTLEIVTPSATTFADPFARNVHLRGDESFFNLVHESMHIWAYDRTAALSGGQFGLVGSLIRDKGSPGLGFGTHDPQEKESTAFHEGFAQFAAFELERREFGGTTASLPFGRGEWAFKEFESIDQLIRSDHGWRSILTTLVTPDLHLFEFGTSASPAGAITQTASPSGTCSSPSTTFEDLLKVFDAHANLGFDHRLSRDEMKDLRKFLERVCAIVGGSMTGRAEDFLRLLDPAETVEPGALFCQV